MEKTAEEKELIRLESRLTKRFHKACADYGLIAEGDHILIGLSGGKDSLALVELLGRRAQIYVPRFRVTAVHVRVEERDYQSDTSYLEEFCKAWNVPLLVRDTRIGEAPAGAQNGSVGEASGAQNGAVGGRKREKDPCFLCSWYRRKVLFDVAQELGCNKIALGHHKDDLVETLLMNLIYQGAFATIPPLLELERMPIEMIRPLCLVEERDIARYAVLRGYRKQAKLCPFEKESSRAVVKQLVGELEALNPNVRDSIWGAMENIKGDYLPRRKGGR